MEKLMELRGDGGPEKTEPEQQHRAGGKSAKASSAPDQSPQVHVGFMGRSPFESKPNFTLLETCARKAFGSRCNCK